MTKPKKNAEAQKSVPRITRSQKAGNISRAGTKATGISKTENGRGKRNCRKRSLVVKLGPLSALKRHGGLAQAPASMPAGPVGGGEAPEATGGRGGMNSTGAASSPPNHARPAAFLPPSRPPFPTRHPPDLPATATASDLTPLVADTHPEQTTSGDAVAAHDVFEGVSSDTQHPPAYGKDNRDAWPAGGYCATEPTKAQARDDGGKRQTGEAITSIADGEGPSPAEGPLLLRPPQLLRPGADERKLVSETQDPVGSVSTKKRPAEGTEEDSWTVQRQDERQKKKVRFMTDGSPIKPSEQYGDTRSQPMDSEKHDTTASSVTAGPGAAVGTAAPQKQQLPDPVTAEENQGEAPKDPATQSMDAFPASDVSQQNPTHTADTTPSILTQDTSASLHAMASPAKGDGDGGIRDPFSMIGREDVQPQRPHPSQHLLALYGLSPLAASVARFDPVTGEKINRLRKSYEGQIAKLGLSGRNKSVKHEFDPEHKRLGLEELVRYPAEEWHIQHETKTPLAKGWNASGSWEVTGAFKEKLERAFTFDTTPVPKSINADWEYHLGHEKARVKTKPAAGAATPVNGPVKVNGVQHGSSIATGASVRTSTPTNAGGEAARPRRAGKKRRYNDDSFEGYGEGFVDDDAGSDGGDSSNEGSRSSKKKRRKDSTAGTMPPRPQGRMGSYGPGMIHQTGIGAFGR